MNLTHVKNYNFDKFFEDSYKKGEYIGLAKLQKDDLGFFWPLEGRKEHVVNYLKNSKHFSFPKIVNKNFKGDEYFMYNIEFYCKYAWLTHEYLKNKKFNNYMGAHWDLDNKKWCIHPGGSRQLIYNLFGKNTETFLAFNTGGKKVNWQKVYKSKKQFDEDFENYMTGFCKDHGTIIPHIHFDNDSILPNVVKMHKKLQQFFKQTRIVANFDLESWGYEPIKKYKKELAVTIENDSLENQLKAFLIMPAHYKFNDHGVKIEYT